MTERAKENHIFNESYHFTENDAINISTQRDGPSPYNTVFARPHEMLECETDDLYYRTLIISKDKVQAYQCTRVNPGQWSVENLGMVHAYFAIDGSHFPGKQYLYKNIKFLNN